jgi:hypothetical protein
MTGFNNNGKFVPSTPKTYTVSELRDTQQPVKKSGLSVAARSKVVNRSGSGYLSPWADTDISEIAGYGPIERFTSLIISCPACTNKAVTGWVHVIDGYNVEISNEARIRCPGCYHCSHIKNWLFACSQHRGEYRATNQTSFTRAVLIAINNKRVDAALMTELLSYLEDHTW